MRLGLVEELVVDGVAVDGLRGGFGGEINAVASFRAVSDSADVDDVESFLAVGRGVFARAGCTFRVVIISSFLHY